MIAKWKQIETYLKKLKKEDAPTVSIAKGGVDFNPTGLSKKKKKLKKELDGRTSAYKLHRRKLEAQREKRKKMRAAADTICGSFRENLEDKFDEFKPVINEDNMKTLHDIVRTKGAKPLKFRDGQIKVDIQTANIILKVLPRVKTKSTVDKMTTIINKGRKAQFIKLVSSLQGTLSGSFTNGIRNRPI